LLDGEIKLQLIANELSFHGQFNDLPSFKAAIDRLMKLRIVARQFGREILCHRNFSHAVIMPATPLGQAIQAFSMDERRAFLAWIAQNGPFWDDNRTHCADDYLEHNGVVVTDTAVGEAAWCRLNSIEAELVSVTPSNWLCSPLDVLWVSSNGQAKSVDVQNHWDVTSLEKYLRIATPVLSSWAQLETVSRGRFTNLNYAQNTFTPLVGEPFVLAAANKILVILDVLNRFKTCFDANGARTQLGHEIYQEFFTGKKGDGGRGPMFSDSSDTEKRDFKKELTFPSPLDPSIDLFCTWHGKVQTPQFRVHFSWPVKAKEPLHVVYVGDKLTKR
jgi:hypothetical protein